MTEENRAVASTSLVLRLRAGHIPRPADSEALMEEAADYIEALRAWISLAAPVLNAASCIVIEDSVHRIGEISGCRAILETCPCDWQNAAGQATASTKL